MKKYFGMGALILLMACNSADKKTAEGKDTTNHKTEVIATVAPDFKDVKLQNIYTSYISLKNALVSSKQDEAKVAAKALGAELKNYTGCENTAITANKIEAAKDIVEQRKEFTSLSSDVIAMFKHAELTKGAIFVQHCPMANKGEGGDWLASEKKIQNPYYGSEMMECGAVIEEIKAK
ncbi:DUF3347 domain-containing protein [Pedobacter frigiditerrae]|uniref:DUF3347 domain-containing protein n=1 Tax=Pedobacter frigiditerrae TaxID=2530452 RepID=UPI0029319457|nr:DUF3347 domain-containing protein [Pedobacter frigiditerrae]